MEWNSVSANSLLSIDQQVGNHQFPPAEYEIVRRIIYETADLDYLSQVHFSQDALHHGAAALAARTAIIVDSPVIEAGIAYGIQNSFANPIYYSVEHHQSYGLLNLARRYPQGIFVVGREQTALLHLAKLMANQEIQPAFTIFTAPKFIEINALENKLNSLTLPHIKITGCKGNASVAIGIMNGLIDLAWQVYAQ